MITESIKKKTLPSRIHVLAKHDSLPAQCLDCKVLFACKGECPKNRFMKTAGGEPGLNCLCAGWRHFFNHSYLKMNTIGSLLHSGHSAAEIMKNQIQGGDKRKTSAKY